MKTILTLFMLAVFAFFLTPGNAEAILNLDADTAMASLAKEPVFLVLRNAPMEAEPGEAGPAEVRHVQKWPHDDSTRRGPLADVQALSGIESSTTEGGSGRNGILPGGGSRL